MNESIILIFSIVAAYLLDLLLGDPTWLPHPIVGFGKSISFLEKKFNKGKLLYWKGAFMTIFLTSSTFIIFYLLISYVEERSFIVLVSLNTIFIFFGIANKTLIKEGRAVFKVLKYNGLKAGRKQLSRIVGRDTSQLSENQIRIAVLETLSENLSDGVVAPLLYYAIGGVPAMMTYKMINTLDSMIAYKNKRYLKFGFFAAKLDDLVNFIPARLTAIFMAILALSPRSFTFIIRYRNAHSSPNAVYPEAALAGILNCRFGGNNVYNGQLVKKAYIGDNQRDINDSDIHKAVWINHSVSLICIIIICSIEWLNI